MKYSVYLTNRETGYRIGLCDPYTLEIIEYETKYDAQRVCNATMIDQAQNNPNYMMFYVSVNDVGQHDSYIKREDYFK